MPACRGKHLTALTVNKNRRLLSFAQRGDRPHVVVFDLAENKRKKVVMVNLILTAKFKRFKSNFINFIS